MKELINYEVVYLLNPNIQAESVLTFAGNITKAIEEAGGSVQYVAEPKKRKLSYPIKKFREAYMGFTDFLLLSDKVALVKKALEEEKEIMRFLVVLHDVSQKFSMRREFLTQASSRREERDVAPLLSDRPQKQDPSRKVEEKIDIETIDKKLEEILNK